MCVYAGTYLDAEVLAHCPPGRDLDRQPGSRPRPDHRSTGGRRTRAGRDVARLCSGDPSLYSALAEQTRRLDAAGVPWDVTPGVPAYAAAAALLGRELTVPELAQTVILTRTYAESTAMPESESLAGCAETRATLVLHLAIRHIRRPGRGLGSGVRRRLSRWPWCPGRPSRTRSCLRGTLADIADQVEAAELRQAAVILVGEALRRRGLRGVPPVRQTPPLAGQHQSGDEQRRRTGGEPRRRRAVREPRSRSRIFGSGCQIR